MTGKSILVTGGSGLLGGEIQYLCAGRCNQKGESGIYWNEQDIGIEWPVTIPLVSQKDQEAVKLSRWLTSKTQIISTI